MSERVFTEPQNRTIFEIAQMFGGKFKRTGRRKSYRQKLWRCNGIIVEYHDSLVVWNISPSGIVFASHIDRKDQQGNVTGWVDIEIELERQKDLKLITKICREDTEAKQT